MSHPLENSCLRLGSEQHGSESGRLARTKGVSYLGAPLSLSPHTQPTVGRSGPPGAGGSPRTDRGLEEATGFHSQCQASPRKCLRQGQTGSLSGFQHRGPRIRGNAVHISGGQQGHCAPRPFGSLDNTGESQAPAHMGRRAMVRRGPHRGSAL